MGFIDKVSCEGLRKDFIRKREGTNVFTAVSETTLSFERGLSVIYGSSGSGKTTFLSMLSGVLEPSQGIVKFGDTSIYDLSDNERSRFRREILSLVPQGQTSIQSLNVLENVLLPFSISHTDVSKEVIERAEYHLESLGLIDLKDVYPSELSGGENRRLAFARAFTRNTDILILDEPTADLDDDNAKIVIELLREYSREHIVIAATHDINLRSAKDMLYKMDKGVIERV